ncbi:hypothetical protein [Rickettsiales endosymbiont of Trichoplax sp. H2]|uniref:hypothetical protein n=1 Tax=Rickettsiales endosymbiont of Trichoplax sp. H2 TaxID=2021221 RepID=UPI0012B3DD13|nr:hypothetical protein [Rickettsiales endosymbiont of Trichoplax sp. H2]MSO14317.1 hypothetical protein [Rickettsiales endosymbiont of Trichoplax sp. H2]
MYNKDNNSKRSNSSNKNELNLQNEEDLNKVSNRSENGSDTIKNDSNRASDNDESKNEKIEENSTKKKEIKSIEEVDEKKQELIEGLNKYLSSSNLKKCLEGIELKTKTQFINKYKEYIDRFQNSDNYEDNKKIDTKEKLGCKILNCCIEILKKHKNTKNSEEIKNSEEYKNIKEAITSIYDDIYKDIDDDINFSFNDNDISQIDINTNELSQTRVNNNDFENIPALDFSVLNNEVTNRNQINEENKEDENEKSVKKMDEKEGYGAVLYNYYKHTKDQLATKVNEYFKSKSNKDKNDELDNSDNKELYNKFMSMKDNNEFVESKGGTVEEISNNYNLETNQNVFTNTQQNNEEVVQSSNDYSYYKYAICVLTGACIVMQALSYMSDHHDYHGFGSSGF